MLYIIVLKFAWSRPGSTNSGNLFMKLPSYILKAGHQIDIDFLYRPLQNKVNKHISSNAKLFLFEDIFPTSSQSLSLTLITHSFLNSISGSDVSWHFLTSPSKSTYCLSPALTPISKHKMAHSSSVNELSSRLQMSSARGTS